MTRPTDTASRGWSDVRDRLARLADVFGPGTLEPPLTPGEPAALETRLRVELPGDHTADGGGFFPLIDEDGGRMGFARWHRRRLDDAEEQAMRGARRCGGRGASRERGDRPSDHPATIRAGPHEPRPRNEIPHLPGYSSGGGGRTWTRTCRRYAPNSAKFRRA